MTFRNRGQARSADQRVARRKVMLGTHELVLVAQGQRTTAEIARVAAQVEGRWEDLRRGKLTVYGSLLRFIDVAIALGVSRQRLKTITEWIDWYIDDRCDERAKTRQQDSGEFQIGA